MCEERDPGRWEFKYALPVLLRPRLVELLADHVEPDPHAGPLGVPWAPGARGYTVHSLYFDTPELADYTARLDERRVRDRIRVRTYGRPGEGQPVFLENKRKLDERVVKHRVAACTAEEWAASPPEAPWRPWVARLRGQRRYAGEHFDRLARLRRPVTLVHYVREIYVGRRRADRQVRVNMDSRITVAARPDPRDLHAPGRTALLPEDWMVLEIKFDDDPPGWMRRVVRELRLVAEPVSKFGLGVARALRADRPAEARALTPRALRRLGRRP